MKTNLLIILAALLLSGCRTDAVIEKDVALNEVYSLRDMPGDDGCVPGAYSSPYIFKGETFYAICADATEYR
ncbi:hypothetical protein [Pseudomonas sp.]|uniref:hypothetical protein n=1 Tax=Pseudomonas sp. TaxID=306 RepID=UPI0025911C10|nr:hypothetical protein [Pseudomonas sp.]